VENNIKLETLVKCKSVLIDMAKDIKNTANMIELECEKVKSDEAVLRALLKSLKEFLEDYLIDMSDIDASKETDSLITNEQKVNFENEINEILKRYGITYSEAYHIFWMEENNKLFNTNVKA
jgi:hypothetical protein